MFVQTFQTTVKYCGGETSLRWSLVLSSADVQTETFTVSNTGQGDIVGVEVVLSTTGQIDTIDVESPCTKWRIRRSRSMRHVKVVFVRTGNPTDFHMHECHYFSCIYEQ